MSVNNANSDPEKSQLNLPQNSNDMILATIDTIPSDRINSPSISSTMSNEVSLSNQTNQNIDSIKIESKDIPDNIKEENQPNTVESITLQSTDIISTPMISTSINLSTDKYSSKSFPSTLRSVSTNNQTYHSETQVSQTLPSECLVTDNLTTPTFQQTNSNQSTIESIAYSQVDHDEAGGTIALSQTVNGDTICDSTISGITEDGKNVEIIYIPISFTRPISTELMMAMTQDSCEFSRQNDENEATTITLDEANHSLLVTSENIENLDCNNTMVTMESLDGLHVVSSSASQLQQSVCTDIMNQNSVVDMESTTICTTNDNPSEPICISSNDASNNLTKSNQEREDVFTEGVEVLCW